MKAFTFCTPSHRELLDNYLIPSLPKDLELHVTEGIQKCPSATYQKEGWVSCQIDKVGMIIEAIENNYGDIILHLDADIQFFTSEIEPIILQYIGDDDIIGQSDDKDGTGTFICSGVFAVRCSPETKKLFERVSEIMKLLHVGDQDALNLALYEKKFPSRVKDIKSLNSDIWSIHRNGGHVKLFPSDVVWSPRFVWKNGDPLNISPNTVIHHANWCLGVTTKVLQLRKCRRIMATSNHIVSENPVTKPEVVKKKAKSKIFEGGPPISSFSEADCIENGTIKGSILFGHQPIPEMREDSELLNSGLNQTRISGWRGLWCMRPDTYLAHPTMAHMNENGEVAIESTYNTQGGLDPVWNRNSKKPVRKLEGDYTSLISRWNPGYNYYHWLMDGLTRLSYLKYFPRRCKILIPKNLPAFALRSLELLGLTNRLEETSNEDLIVERYWFAGPIAMSGHPNPFGVNWLREQFLKEEPVIKNRLIYVERNAPTRRLHNEKQVTEFFKNIGWECVDPGKLSFDEQIKIFREAKAIAGAHGAAMTNVLWTSPGTKILEFMPEQRRNGCMAGIALLCGADHRSLVLPSDSGGGMTIPLNELALEISKMGLIEYSDDKTRITVSVIHWKRPENLDTILLSHESNPMVSEVIVWNNNPDMVIKPRGKANVINSSRDMGLDTRFHAALLAKTDIVLIQDDDILLPHDTVRSLVDAYIKEPDRIHGLFGRVPNPDGSYGKDINFSNSEADTVLTRALVVGVKYIPSFFSFKADENIIKSYECNVQNGLRPQNGEDIVFSYAVMNATGKRNKVYALPSRNLPTGDESISTNPHHRICRTDIMKACIEKLKRKPLDIKD